MARRPNLTRRRCPKKGRRPQTNLQARHHKRATLRRDAVIQRHWEAATRWSLETGKPAVLAFFGSQNPYPFSNHAKVTTRFQGVTYPTSEHAYLALQAKEYGLHREAREWSAGKGTGYDVHRQPYDLSNPKRVKAASTKIFRPFRNNPNHPGRKKWLAIRNHRMFQIVMAKFRSCSRAKTALLATGYQYLVENSPSDDHWGVGRRLSNAQLQDGPFHNQWGRNQLGLILMGVRDALRYQMTRVAQIKRNAIRTLARKYVRDHPKESWTVEDIMAFPFSVMHRQLKPIVSAVRSRKRRPEHPPLPRAPKRSRR